jgi:tetratricopeptide (TPR) repeat protein
MDQMTATALREAFELFRAGKQSEAQAIIVQLIKANPNLAEAWYLLGLTLADPQRKLSAFQQVLRIDPANQAAQKQIAQLQAVQSAPQGVKTPHIQPFTDEEEPVSEALPQPIPAIPPRLIPDAAQKPAIVIPPKIAPAVASEPQVKKTKRAFPVKLSIALFAVIGVLAFYLGYGIKINQQVRVLFSAQKCTEVVQFESFKNLFPRVLFSSFFGLYTRLDECQADLSIEQAVSAQDWALAYTKIEAYLSQFPNGIFTSQINDLAGEVLYAWSKGLVVQNDYSAAIEKLKLVQDKYPTSKVARTALDAMFVDYILWAKALLAQKNYPNSEKYLILVSSHALASEGQVQQANQELGKLYLEWAKAQVESGDLDRGLKHLERARELDPGLADYDQLINHVTLLQALALAESADFDQALEKTRKASETTQAEEAKAEAVAVQAKILDGYAHSSADQARAQIAAAIGKTCSQQLPDLPIFGLDPENIRFGMSAPFGTQLPADWLASRPAELHFVLCASESEPIIQSCSYPGEYTLRRKRYVWTVNLYDLVTGQLYQTTELEGSVPRTCYQGDYFSAGLKTKDVYGDRPTVGQITDWLTGLKLTP